METGINLQDLGIKMPEKKDKNGKRIIDSPKITTALILIQKLFNAYWCRPPSRVTGTSSWPSVDHLVSRLPPLTVRPVQARFHCGYVSRDTQPRQ